MRSREFVLLAVIGVVLQIGVVVAPSSAREDLVLNNCLVRVKDAVRIPAQRPGVLVEMPVREGSRVEKGELLAKIDDREAQAQLKVAEYGLNAALKRAEDTIEERYATKAADVAKMDWEQDLEANERYGDAVPASEIRQKKLVWDRSRLQIEKAQKDRELARLDANTKEAERDAALVALEKSSVTAPFTGEVVTIDRKESEWVNPGDPILKFMRFDKLYVESTVSVHRFDRGDLQKQLVTVMVKRAHDREVKVPGKIVYVGQTIDSMGNFTVRAEIENQMEENNWIVQPGMNATMTVHFDQPPAGEQASSISRSSTTAANVAE